MLWATYIFWKFEDVGDFDFLKCLVVLWGKFYRGDSIISLSRDLQEQPLRLEGTLGLKSSEQPETVPKRLNKSEHLPFAFEADVWSLGVVLYEMCCLKAQEIKMQPDLVCVIWIYEYEEQLCFPGAVSGQ